MKRSILSLLATGCVFLAMCKSTPSSKCGPCPLYAQVAPIINIRIVDRTTGGDLFLSPNSPYKYSDLKITTSLPGQDVYATVDSTQTNNRSVRIIVNASQTLTLKLGNLSANNIAVVTKQDSPQCCPVFKITKIMLDDGVICNSCSYDELVTIKK
ncbi:MAG TPA: hypothetical protein VHE59_16765 [Mucilaginibacter sp.]|nr:hypothetical protein [Mucilaginibacter sp.]